MHQCLVSAFPWMIITCFIFTLAAQSAGDNGDPFTDEISINCGSTGPSVSLDGRTWTGDFCSNLTIQGSSIRSTVTREPVSFAEPVLYKTARISSSRFSYIFRLDSGQKLIRLHFNPTSYNGFEMSQDLFTVRAGSFTLLSNFSASITANALGVNFLIKEFCIILEQNCLLNVTFSPVTVTCQSRDTHAFINAIQVISVPESLSYTGEKIPLIGEKFPVYIDNSTALEMVHRQSVKRDCVTPGDDFRGMFGMSNEQVKNITWRISVDIGFRYLVRFHFSELGLRMAENGNNSFALVINHMVAYTNARVPGQKEDQSDEHGIVYRNYMVMAKGCKQEGKRDIFISLQPKNEFLYGHGPLQGFEIFKLSNHDNSLGSPNPSPTEQGPFWTFRHTFSVLGNRNTVATAAIMIICLVNVIVHMLRQTWEVYFPEEEKKPTTRVSRICRCFSLTEIQAATENFNDSFVVGKGGFGKVYKGFIGYNREIVAIKRKKTDSKQGNREFWTEVETLSELRHVNLVSLIGYCNDEQEMILVYEYMPNGTLADHLYKLARKKSKFTSLSWEERLQICIGAGRGLDYLHTGKGVIHRDIKASNILLDENFVAKVSDFGLAKTECSSGLQNKDSTHIKGTFGYIDPEYFKTRKLTTRSDTYAFGVVLLEVLCGRPAVDPLAAEDERSLTIWALDNIRRGRVDQILAPCVSDGISPDSLKTFLKIVESCLHDEPNKRPPIVHAVISLEFSLELQKKKPSLSNDIASFADLLPFTNRTQQENANLLVVNEMTEAADIVQRDNRAQSENATSLLPNEITCVADILPRTDRASRSTMQLTMASSHMQSMTCLMKEETDSRMVNAEPPNGKKDGQKYLISKLSRLFSWVSVWKGATPSKRTRFAGIPKSAPIAKNSKKEQTSCRIVDTEPPDGKRDARKSVMYKLSRFFPWHSVREEKPYKRKDFAGISISAPLTKYFSNKTSLRSSTAYQKTELAEGGKDDMILSHNFRIYSFSELKVATRNFRPDSVLGEGGFGRVFKGFLQEKSTNTDKVGSIIAVKKLNHESWQGFKEWLAEINFLGKLSHRNIVKLLGYCLEDRELLLVYEFMQKGSLENHLFRRNHAVEPLSWQLRLKILIGAACGLAYLHSLDTPVILRDFKTSNILLDGSYNAKLSDLGLARLSASVDHSHVSTRVVGTYGYAAPEYVATGHLYVKSDVYGFGVVMLEILTGMRALDRNRPYGQHSLVDWIMPMHKRSVKRIIDVRLEGRYPSKSAMQVYQLAKSCLNADVKSRPSMEEVIVKLEAASVKVLEGVSYQVKNTSP